MPRLYQPAPAEHPERPLQLDDPHAVIAFLAARGINCQHWSLADLPAVEETAGDDALLDAYRPWLAEWMAEHGYLTMDVVRVTPQTPGLDAIRQKFLAEHTHAEDEVRLFLAGQGYFWFHRTPASGPEEVFCIACSPGDLLSVPAGEKHWFDLGPAASVTALRIFTDAAGWVPQYTGSGTDERYRWPEAAARP